jgi:hypothetical protein
LLYKVLEVKDLGGRRYRLHVDHMGYLNVEDGQLENGRPYSIAVLRFSDDGTKTPGIAILLASVDGRPYRRIQTKLIEITTVSEEVKLVLEGRKTPDRVQIR